MKTGYVYQIGIRDGSLSDKYVGSSFNLKRRRQAHKQQCKAGSHLPVYRFISEHGGWENFETTVLESVTTDSKLELSRHERLFVETMMPSLNRISPPVTPTRCEHGRRGKQCRECGGASYCRHDRLRYQCKPCGGSGICEHNRHRVACMDCDPERYQRLLDRKRERRAAAAAAKKSTPSPPASPSRARSPPPSPSPPAPSPTPSPPPPKPKKKVVVVRRAPKPASPSSPSPPSPSPPPPKPKKKVVVVRRAPKPASPPSSDP